MAPGAAQAVAAGQAYTCVIAVDGVLTCWGANTYGQTDAPGDLGAVRQVSAGVQHTCAIDANNRVRCWGDDRDAQDQSSRELPLLEKEVREGQYLEAIARGNQLVGAGTLTEPDLAAIYRQLVEALVALDAYELASDACHEWRRNDPDVVLDPMELSPKIMRACAAAEGSRGVGPVGSTFPSASALPSVGPGSLSLPPRGRQVP